jgi:hypothetical protein
MPVNENDYDAIDDEKIVPKYALQAEKGKLPPSHRQPVRMRLSASRPISLKR